MKDLSTEQQFYLDLYWDQRRIAQERLVRRFNLGLFSGALLMIAAVPLFIRWAISQGVDLSTSFGFQALLGLGVISWILLLLHLIWPFLFFSLAGKFLLSKQHDRFCRDIGLARDDKFRGLLANKALRHKKDSLGKTPLFYLCRTNRFEMVQELIGKDKSLINQKDSLGETPFIEALRSGHSQIVKWMLEQGAQFRNGFTPFMAMAATTDPTSLYQYLAVNNTDSEISDDGTTPLLIAARARQFANVDVLLEKLGSCTADNYSSHPMDWILAAHAPTSFRKMTDFISRKQVDAEYLDRANNSFLHKAVMTDFLAATDLLFQRFPKSAVIKNSDRRTPEDLAASDPKYAQHLAIFRGQAPSAPSGQNSTAATTSQNSYSTNTIDFDDIAVSLEMALTGFDRGKKFADHFSADLRHFHGSNQSHLQLWIGSSGKDKTDRALKAIEVLNDQRYAGIFQPHYIHGHEHLDRITDLFGEFANTSLYPDRSVIFIEDAEMLLDPSENTVDQKTHKYLLKRLNALRSSRKILFVFIGSFNNRKRPLTPVEKNEIFGEDLASLVMERVFYPPEVHAFMVSVLPEFENQDIQPDEDGLLLLLHSCVKRNISKEGFFVALRELHHFFDSRPQKTFTKEEVQTYLDQVERKVS